MRTATSHIAQDTLTKQDTPSWDVSAGFTKSWGDFTVYRFLDTAWETVVGYLAKEGLEGKPAVLDLAPWIDMGTLVPQLDIAAARITQGLPYTIRFSIKALGQVVCLQETGFLMGSVLTDDATIKGILQDITAQKAAQDEMERQRLFYEGTLNKMPVELVVLDKTQHYIFCNKTAIKNDELRAWLIGKTDLDYCLHRGKDPKTVALRQAYFHQAVTSRSEVEWEEVQKNDQGENDYNLKRYSPILGPDGEIVIVIGYGFNISDRRRAEIRAKQSDELIRSLAQNVQEGIFRLTIEGKLLFANEAFYNLMPGDISYKLRNGLEDEETQELLDLLLNDQKEQSGREVSVQFSGEKQSWLLSCRPTADKAFIDGVVVDITGIKQVQADLELKNVELEKAYMELDRFVYSASHDLRAPLTSVLGLVKVMEAEHENGMDMSNAMPYVSMIKSSVIRLDSFVKEIIQYYRNNRTEVLVQEVDFGQIVNGIYDSLQHLRPEMNLVFACDDHLDAALPLDVPRLNIILNNLISNAVKYHTVVGGFVRTSIRLEGDRIILQVQDNGPGILPEHHSRLFDMFYRVGFDNSGSGLGLYIVHETVKKLGGDISFESTPGEGTTFSVTLPLQTA